MSEVRVDFKLTYLSDHDEDPLEVLDEWQTFLMARILACGYLPIDGTPIGEVTVIVPPHLGRISIIQWVKDKL
jgi:hypothetical protein